MNPRPPTGGVRGTSSGVRSDTLRVRRSGVQIAGVSPYGIVAVMRRGGFYSTVKDNAADRMWSIQEPVP